MVGLTRFKYLPLLVVEEAFFRNLASRPSAERSRDKGNNLQIASNYIAGRDISELMKRTRQRESSLQESAMTIDRHC